MLGPEQPLTRGRRPRCPRPVWRPSSAGVVAAWAGAPSWVAGRPRSSHPAPFPSVVTFAAGSFPAVPGSVSRCQTVLTAARRLGALQRPDGKCARIRQGPGRSVRPVSVQAPDFCGVVTSLWVLAWGLRPLWVLCDTGIRTFHTQRFATVMVR